MQARSVVERSTPGDPMPEELAGRRPPQLRALSWEPGTGVEAVAVLHYSTAVAAHNTNRINLGR